jgi:hypothetical protein
MDRIKRNSMQQSLRFFIRRYEKRVSNTEQAEVKVTAFTTFIYPLFLSLYFFTLWECLPFFVISYFHSTVPRISFLFVPVNLHLKREISRENVALPVHECTDCSRGCTAL